LLDRLLSGYTQRSLGGTVVKFIRYLLVGALLGLVLSAFAQNSLEWKEYRYPADQFAITFPSAPTPHPDPQLPNTNTYTAAGVSVRVTRAAEGCDWAVDKMFDGIGQTLSGKTKPDDNRILIASSVKNGTDHGHRYVEFSQGTQSGIIHYERWLCGDAKLYVIATEWPDGVSMPPDTARILASFHLL
jgi:hypothetical protein